MNLNNFIKELAKMDVLIDSYKLEQLEKYYQMLIDYNKVMNLTGITDKSEVYLKHFYDSLSIAKIINLKDVSTLCDIGTGAGFPGLVLKIVFPHLKITLIDSLNKRITFLNDVIKQLGLEDIEAIHYRVEEYGIDNREIFDIVTVRAVASTNVLLEYAIPLVKVDGYFIPMKGKISNEPSYEHAAKELKVIVDEKLEFLLPFEKSFRTLIKFRKIDITSKKYPRKYADIKKKPL